MIIRNENFLLKGAPIFEIRYDSLCYVYYYIIPGTSSTEVEQI